MSTGHSPTTADRRLAAASRSKSGGGEQHGLRRPQIVHRLLTDIVSGKMQVGQRLVTQQLADRFGVSHTPVREALIELAGVGIVQIQPNRGAVVREISRNEIRELCQVRKALECEAVRSACRRIHPSMLQELRSECVRLRDSVPATGTTAHAAATGRRPIAAAARVVNRAQTVDSDLHDLIASHCGNALLESELKRLSILFRAFRDLAFRHVSAANDLRRVVEEADEHLAILDALLAIDPRMAARAMSRHIRRGMMYWTRAIADSATPLPEVASADRHSASY